MKTIGVIGGMSWESSLEYYRILNQETARRLGGRHSAPCVLYSVDFAPLADAMHEDRWDDVRAALEHGARSVSAAGAQLVLLATNTMHIFADAVEQAAGVPLCHIAEATGTAAAERGLHRMALLGTRFTMEKPFYSDYMERHFGIETVVPEPEATREELNRIIFDELVQGEVRERSSEWLRLLIEELAAQGAEGILLACTELGLAVRNASLSVPALDTTEIHARTAVERALSG